MSSKPEITHDTPDSRGYIPETALLGSQWFHYGNGHTYTLVRFAWNGEDDTWMYVHTRKGSTFEYLRTPANFHGLRESGHKRYTRV